MSPKHSIDYCPICGGGLCGIRVCGLSSPDVCESVRPDDPKILRTDARTEPHGLVVCDECEAIWLEPDTSTDHLYPSAEHASCPICSEPLWGKQSRWANSADVQRLGWSSAVNPALDQDADEELI